MTESLRVGVVGGGVIAAKHIPYIRKAGGILVGVAELSTVRANDLADRFALRNIYRSVVDMIDAERPDVVHVLTPPHTHAEVAVAAGLEVRVGPAAGDLFEEQGIRSGQPSP